MQRLQKTVWVSRQRVTVSMAGGIIFCFLTFPLLPVVLSVNCTSSEVKIGDQANVTCNFSAEENVENGHITIHKIDVSNRGKSVLECFGKTDERKCYNARGYKHVDSERSSNLTLIIPSVTEKHLGQYVCQRMKSSSGFKPQCMMIKEREEREPTDDQAEKGPLSNTVITVLAVLSGIIVLAVCLLLKTRIRKKLACYSENRSERDTTIPLMSLGRGLLIAGKTGNGKSTLGNTLLGGKFFPTGSGLVTTTTTAEVTKAPDGHVEVMELPDICNSDMPETERERETSKVREFISRTPAPYVVLVVRCDVVYTAEEYALYNKLKELWGNPDSFCDQLVVAFCFGDRLKCDKRNLTTKVSPKLKSVLKDASNRYVVFNNDSSCTQEEKKRAAENLLGILRDLATQDLG